MYNPYCPITGRVRMQNFGTKVSGGMSEAATRRLQNEERAWQQQQTELAYQRQKEMQAESEERAAAASEREARIEEAENDALQAMEKQVTDEIEAQKKTEDEKDKDITLDFYSSLAQGSAGMAKRPD